MPRGKSRDTGGMSDSRLLVTILERELNAAGLGCADIARTIGVSEKRAAIVLSSGAIQLTSIDKLLALLDLRLDDLLGEIARAPFDGL